MLALVELDRLIHELASVVAHSATKTHTPQSARSMVHHGDTEDAARRLRYEATSSQVAALSVLLAYRGIYHKEAK